MDLSLVSKHPVPKTNLDGETSFIWGDTYEATEIILCPHCDKSFNNNSDLDHHLLIHARKNPYECSICKRMLSSKVHFIFHSRSHFKKQQTTIQPTEYPFKCNVCKICFASKQRFVNHRQIHSKHSENYPYECEVCKELFFNKLIFLYHSRTHSKNSLETFRYVDIQNEEKPEFVRQPPSYLCECVVCRKSFRHKFLFNHHKCMT